MGKGNPSSIYPSYKTSREAITRFISVPDSHSTFLRILISICYVQQPPRLYHDTPIHKYTAPFKLILHHSLINMKRFRQSNFCQTLCYRQFIQLYSQKVTICTCLQSKYSYLQFIIQDALSFFEIIIYSKINPLMQIVTTFGNNIRRKYYHLTNSILTFKKIRWLITLSIVCSYFYRSFGCQYSVVTYLIFLYLVQLAVSYFTPKGLIQTQDSQSQQMTELESMLIQDFQFMAQHEDGKPLLSELGQFQIWQRVSAVFITGLICTMFKAIQIDVFWPLLMVYFIGLICYTFQKIVKKMKKYQYSVSDFKKKPYAI